MDNEKRERLAGLKARFKYPEADYCEDEHWLISELEEAWRELQSRDEEEIAFDHAQEVIGKYMADCERLEKELEAAKADTARLDWCADSHLIDGIGIGTTGDYIDLDDLACSKLPEVFNESHERQAYRDALREAIDAARGGRA